MDISCLVVNTITVYSYGFLFNCMTRAISFGPAHEILVLITSSRNKGLDNPVHIHSFARASPSYAKNRIRERPRLQFRSFKGFKGAF